MPSATPCLLNAENLLRMSGEIASGRLKCQDALILRPLVVKLLDEIENVARERPLDSVHSLEYAPEAWGVCDY